MRPVTPLSLNMPLYLSMPLPTFLMATRINPLSPSLQAPNLLCIIVRNAQHDNLSREKLSFELWTGTAVLGPW